MRPKQNIYIILPSHSFNSHHLNRRRQGPKPEETHQPVSSSWTPPQLYEGSTGAMAPALLHLPQHQQPVLGQVLVLPPALKPHHLPHRLKSLGSAPSFTGCFLLFNFWSKGERKNCLAPGCLLYQPSGRSWPPSLQSYFSFYKASICQRVKYRRLRFAETSAAISKPQITLRWNVPILNDPGCIARYNLECLVVCRSLCMEMSSGGELLPRREKRKVSNWFNYSFPNLSMSTRAHSSWRTFQEGNVTSGWFEYQAAVFDLDFCFKSKSEKIDLVGSTVCYEMMKLCTGSV